MERGSNELKFKHSSCDIHATYLHCPSFPPDPRMRCYLDATGPRPLTRRGTRGRHPLNARTRDPPSPASPVVRRRVSTFNQPGTGSRTAILSSRSTPMASRPTEILPSFDPWRKSGGGLRLTADRRQNAAIQRQFDQLLCARTSAGFISRGEKQVGDALCS